MIDAGLDRSWDVSILGVDINAVALRKAAPSAVFFVGIA